MQLTRIFYALIFCLALFTSCSVEELEPETSSYDVEDIQANGDGDTDPDDDKGNG